MRKTIQSQLQLILITFVLSFSIATKAQSTEGDELWTNDRKAHAGLSFVLGSAIGISLRAADQKRWAAFITSFTLAVMFGVIKESTDEVFDKKDITANVIGATTGSLLAISFSF